MGRNGVIIMLDAIIIGPSKVGKSALVASLRHASDVATIIDNKLTIRTIPKNKATREIFGQGLEIVRKGDMPFGGTSLDVRYDFVIEVEQEPTSNWERFAALWNANEHEGRFRFMDAPGGTIFSDDIKEKARTDPVFARMVQQMLDSSGLIMCVDMTDALETNPAKIKKIQEYYRECFGFFLSCGFQITVPFDRVCFVLTKADLYLEQSGKAVTEQTLLEQEHHPFEIVKKIIGNKSLEALTVFLEPHSQVCFSTTSVYGFLNGKENPHFKKKNSIIRPEEWQPYNVAESFAFIITGEKHHPSQYILSYDDLFQFVKNI